MMKLRVSGYFKTEPGTDVNSCVFSDLEITLPHRNELYYQRDAMRLLPQALAAHKEYKKKRYEGFVRVDIDEEIPIEGTPVCVGKNLKELTWEELQVFACLYNIREVRLFKSMGLRPALENAYMLYQDKVLKRRVFKNEVQMLQFKQGVQERGQRSGWEPDDVKEKIDKVMDSCYSMIVYPDDPKNSYKFSDQPSIILPDPDKGEIAIAPKKAVVQDKKLA